MKTFPDGPGDCECPQPKSTRCSVLLPWQNLSFQPLNAVALIAITKSPFMSSQTLPEKQMKVWGLEVCYQPLVRNLTQGLRRKQADCSQLPDLGQVTSSPSATLCSLVLHVQQQLPSRDWWVKGDTVTMRSFVKHKVLPTTVRSLSFNKDPMFDSPWLIRDVRL